MGFGSGALLAIALVQMRGLWKSFRRTVWRVGSFHLRRILRNEQEGHRDVFTRGSRDDSVWGIVFVWKNEYPESKALETFGRVTGGLSRKSNESLVGINGGWRHYVTSAVLSPLVSSYFSLREETEPPLNIYDPRLSEGSTVTRLTSTTTKFSGERRGNLILFTPSVSR